MRILWANRYCLLDSSSGASRSAAEILSQLVKLGHEVRVVGATVFDAPVGSTGLGEAWEKIKASTENVVTVTHEPLRHQLVRTKSTVATEMTLGELNTLYSLYRANLETMRPDVVMFYGGNSFDLLIPVEAHKFGALSAAYLVNPNYKGARWADDVDLIFTDSRSTAAMYGREVDLPVIPMGTVIDPARVIAEERTPHKVTFINPSVEKGGILVAQLAMHMEAARPDIEFEVVESRGSWQAALDLCAGKKKRRKKLKNVTVTPNVTDMRPVYARSRLLLAPSLWWESGARVLAEAMLNGVPAVTTDHGGSPEMVGAGGLKLKLPVEFHEAPYNRLFGEEQLSIVTNMIARFFDDEEYYEQMSRLARQHAATYHNRSANILTLEGILRGATDVVKKRDS